MKRSINIVLTLVISISMLVGCGNNSKEIVRTDGSTSMEKVIGALGESFQNNTGITFTYNPTGSGSGIKAVLEGRCDIGLSSRELKGDEKDAGLDITILGYDGIVMIVNTSNPIDDLSLEMVGKIYKGEKVVFYLGGLDIAMFFTLVNPKATYIYEECDLVHTYTKLKHILELVDKRIIKRSLLSVITSEGFLKYPFITVSPLTHISPIPSSFGESIIHFKHLNLCPTVV